MRFHKTRTKCTRCHGFTLVELLVVMGVLSVLAAIALPNIKTMIKQQRLKRAATAVQVYIDGARAKAIGDGQSYGVVIERLGRSNPVDRAQSLLLRYAYAPPAYAGDTAEAVAVVLPSGNLVFSPMHCPTLIAAARQAAAGKLDGIVTENDVIEIGGVGVSLPIQQIRFATVADFQINPVLNDLRRNPGFVPANGVYDQFWPFDGNPTAQQISDWPVIVIGDAITNDTNFDAAERVARVLNPGTTVPFKIFRRPRPSILPPLEMIDGTVIDLTYSGIGIGNPSFSPAAISRDYTPTSDAFYVQLLPSDPPGRDYGSVTIMFDTQGSVGEVRLDNNIIPATSNVYILVGRAGNVRPGDNADGITGVGGPLGFDNSGVANLLDLEAVWIVINRQTGEIYTATVDELPRNADGTLNLPGNTDLQRFQNAITASQVSAAHFYAGG